MSLFGADQVYTCLEKVYMVYTGLPPDVLSTYQYILYSLRMQGNGLVQTCTMVEYEMIKIR